MVRSPPILIPGTGQIWRWVQGRFSTLAIHDISNKIAARDNHFKFVISRVVGDKRVVITLP